MTTTQEQTTKPRKFRWKTHSEERQARTAKAMAKLTKTDKEEFPFESRVNINITPGLVSIKYNGQCVQAIKEIKGEAKQ